MPFSDDLSKLGEIVTERSESETNSPRNDVNANRSGRNKGNVEIKRAGGTKTKRSKVGKSAPSGHVQHHQQQEITNRIMEDLEQFQMTISPKKDAFKVNRDLLFELRVKEKKDSEMVPKNASTNRVRPATAVGSSINNKIAGSNSRGMNPLLGRPPSTNSLKMVLPGRPKTADSYLTNRNKNNATNSTNNNNVIDAASFVEYRSDTREPWRDSADLFFARRKPVDPEAHLNKLRKKNRRKSFLKEFEAETATLYERKTFVPSYSTVSHSILSLNADLAVSEAIVRRRRKEMADGRKIDVFGDESFKNSSKVDVTHVCTRDLSGSQYGAGFTSWAHNSESGSIDRKQDSLLPRLVVDTKSHNSTRRSSKVQFDAPASTSYSSKVHDTLHHVPSAFSPSPTTHHGSLGTKGGLELDMENIQQHHKGDIYHGPSTTDEDLGIIADDDSDDEDTIIQKLLDGGDGQRKGGLLRPFTPTMTDPPPPHHDVKNHLLKTNPILDIDGEEPVDIEAAHSDSDDEDDGMDVDETLYFGPTARTLFYEKYRQLSYLLNQETSISACQSASFQSYKTVAVNARPQSALSFTSHSKSFSASRTELMGFSFPSLTSARSPSIRPQTAINASTLAAGRKDSMLSTPSDPFVAAALAAAVAVNATGDDKKAQFVEEGQLSPRTRYLSRYLETNTSNPPLPIVIRTSMTDGEINLANMGLKDHYIKLLTEIFNDLPRVTGVNVRNNMLTDESLPGLIEAVNNYPKRKARIILMDLSENKIDDDASDALRGLIGSTNCHLKTLRLSNADVSDEEVVALMDALGGNATITDLDISCNSLGSTGEDEVNLNQWQSQASLLSIVEEEGGLIGGPAIAAALSTNQVGLKAYLHQTLQSMYEEA